MITFPTVKCNDSDIFQYTSVSIFLKHKSKNLLHNNIEMSFYYNIQY